MKNRRILTFLGIFALGGALYAGAQDYDDIYYDASKSTKTETVKKSSGSISLTEQTQPTTVRIGKSSVTPVSGNETYKVTVSREGYRDEDEYNRRGTYESINPYDTTYLDNEGSFSNTQRIERFYNPDIIIASNDDELITLYYEDQPTVNLIIGSNWGPSYGWGYSSIFYDPWYSSYPWGWYQWNGWYGPSWYYNWHYGWHHGLYGWGYWNSWAYRPIGYYGYWGYSPWHHWGNRYNYGWDYGWHHGRHGGWNNAGGRRPSSVGRGYANKPSVSGTRSGGGNIGRRPMVGRDNTTGTSSRPGVRYNYGSGNSGIGSGSGTVRGHRSPSMGNIGTSSSGISRGTRPSSTPSRSYGSGSSTPSRSYSTPSRSYSGSSSSSSRSYGGSTNIGGGRSSGGYSGGGHSGGGFSGGGRSGGGGGGGGHRR